MNILRNFIILTSLIAFNASGLELNQNLSNGEMSIKVEWTTNDTGGDALSSFINFTPHNQSPACQKISFIQAARIQNKNAIDYIWKEIDGQTNRNLIKTKTKKNIIPGYFIDHDAAKCTLKGQCTPFYRGSWENPDQSNDGQSSAYSKQSASMFDAPYGWESFETINLEACAVCQNQNKLSILACVKWGGTWPLLLDRSILPVEFNETATPTFIEALRNFFNFYKNIY